MVAEFEIFLRDVMLYSHHGVMPEENVIGNQYRVNVCVRISADEFDEEADDIASTISYAELYDILRHVMSQPVALLETVAVKFGKEVQNKWHNLKSGEIEIIKVVPPISGMIGEAGVCYKF